MHARPRLGSFCSRSVLLSLLAMGAAACAGGGSGGGSGGNGSGGSSSGGASGSGGNSSGGTTGSGGANASGGNTGSGGSVSTGGNTGSGGNSASGGNTGSGGSTASGGNTGSGGNASTGGSGGSASGGNTGSGGTSATGGNTGSGGAAGTTGSGGAAGSAGTCPSNATFCSGFEDPGLPVGAVYMINGAPGDWSRDFAIDTSQHHAGNSSLLVKPQSASGSSQSAYRMLAVPSTPNTFWVRFWIMGAKALGGDSSHNAYAGGSTDDTPNGLMIEFAEDVGIAFNTKDADQWPTGYGRLSTSNNPYVLPAMTWECIEISYDGAGREQQLYVNNVQLIDAKSYPANTEALTYFKFGYDGYNVSDGGSYWFDDVAVAPARIGGCPTVAKSNQ